MLVLTSPTGRRYADTLGKPYKDTKKAVLKQWRGTFPAGSVVMFPIIEGLPLMSTRIFCVSTPHCQGEALPACLPACLPVIC